MAMKRNDAQAQQVVDRKQMTSKPALHVLTATETRNVVAGASHVDPQVMLDKPTAE